MPLRSSCIGYANTWKEAGAAIVGLGEAFNAVKKKASVVEAIQSSRCKCKQI